MASRADNRLMKSLTFGCELEFTGITREQAAKVVAKFFGTAEWYEGAGYDKRTVKDNCGRKWAIMRDSSILPQRKGAGYAGEDYKVELVTPILYYSDIENLQQIVRDLRHAGAKVNRSCGMHIHVGAEKFTPATLRNLSNLFANNEDMIYKALQVDEEHRNIDYCKKTSESYLKELNERKPDTEDAFRMIWYNDKTPYTYHRHYDDSRYRGLNLHAFFTKGTVEFRLFNGTLHAGKVKSYIQFCLALAQQALRQKRASTKKVTSTNEKYAFRCWMLRLGLIGDEFRTCRSFFLKHLDGNSAWRYGAAA